ncbi:MAG: P-type conjugative transfer ATPase TrbB [Candidatus Eremiobacter antarcticus]|nr:MAG: P-type conjugative transfer ATPase TrbB [Candidatus Eremiobacter sp. RRmetagenome_bin22]
MQDALSAAQRRQARLEEKLKRELGPTVLSALADPQVVEVMLNPDGRLWVDVMGSGMHDTGDRMKPAQAESLLGTVAMMLNSVVNSEHPILQAELPLDGSRIGGVLPPIASAPSFAIRKRASLVYSLDDYVLLGSLRAMHADVLRHAIYERKNILIVGAAGSGKTTFANALLLQMSTGASSCERIVVLEDTVELQCIAANRVELHTSEHADMTRLLRTTMRLRPDRIVVGEVRGAEALALLKAWNTGHPGGLATIHANNCAAALVRLEQLIQEANVPAQPKLVAEVVNIVVWIARTPSGRRVQEIVSVRGWTEAGYVLEPLAST